ncbi:hypothetical protein F3Y22_tig00008013pilonHSYRG00049 [Hibiscus syriacus]|uniref:MADS-box domain-containing protein n=1 Tax=Hibiscus syriacus TaxID=106335 RepID=A0A6A3CDQ3_HIBSY|nr:uncharacterized protein LOC120201929 [Hibiscus syriacus]KAE8725841.1 hypothetical protein F3Y22_tig00008013pilonHSYRG00049 [Hibiscus syriacus]
MTRQKVNLTWIVNNTSRRASLKKRRLGLVKKVEELTTLCGIESCLLMCSPGEHEPMAWPSPDDVKQLIEKFYLISEHERMKKMTNMETYMTEKLSKAQNQFMNLNMKNKEAEVGQFMFQMHQGKMVDEFNLNELDALIWFGEARRTNLRKHSQYYKQVPYTSAGPSEGDVLLQPPPQGSAPIVDNEIGSVGASMEDNKREAIEPLSWDDLFHDIMNSNKFRGGASSSSVRGDMNLTHYSSYVAPESLSVAPHLELRGPSYGGSLSVSAADLELSGPSFVGSSSATIKQVSSRHPFGNNSSNVAEQVPPRYPFGGSSSRTTVEQVSSRHPFDGDSLSVAAEHVLPKHSFGDVSTSVDATGLRSPLVENFSTSIANADLAKSDYFDLFGGHDMGPGHYPLGPVTISSPATELNPFEVHGGERNNSNNATSNNCAATSSGEMGPFDDKN